ncbi:hypothetical protein EDD68_10794 [Melghiribacillus thermohalophilus]|uniref:Uncharacterized protein n=1 Tax=Melghiribacillus thermohalophilus TaxID=1324956 RepID=A0A4R3N2Q0_9BACI|nr:hypothetical protein [Melghiribacillus thermohalophilus]TCT23380.1 hypothetical protein EDD68_10794 [Melghiribacillus thermohalophilus]
MKKDKKVDLLNKEHLGEYLVGLVYTANHLDLSDIKSALNHIPKETQDLETEFIRDSLQPSTTAEKWFGGELEAKLHIQELIRGKNEK